MTTIQQQIDFRYKIAYFLEMSYLEYEQLRNSYYAYWCSVYADAFFIKEKLLLSNDAIYNWYSEQWQIWVERELFKSYDDYLTAGILNKNELYHIIYILSQEILEKYPITKLKSIKNQVLVN